MNAFDSIELTCPWCAAPIEIGIDLSAGDQSYVEDCQVCCAPMVVDVRIGDNPEDPVQVTLTREGG